MDFRYRRRRIRKRSPVQTKRGTEQFERQLRQEYAEDENHGKNPFVEPPRFSEYAERWMQEYVRAYNRPSGQTEKTWALRHHLLPAFGERRLDEIGPEAVDAFARRLVGDLAPKTVNNILAVLRTALHTAEEWGLLRRAPRIRQLRVPEQAIRFLNFGEITRLVDATPNPFWRVFTLTLASTGLRFGEAAALHWEDVLLDDEFPRIVVRQAAARGVISQTKTGRIRVIPLSSAVVESLAQFPRTEALVFPKRSGGVMKSSSHLDVLHRACDRAGVKRIGWHGLRHSYATLLCERGVPLRDVQELLGHTTITMTSRYAHSRPENLRHWVNRCFGDHKSPVAGRNGHQVDTKPHSLPEPDSVGHQVFAQPSANSRLVAGV